MEEKKAILLIDDDPDIAEAVRAIITLNADRLLWADSGTAGMNLLKKEKPDLILLDIFLPDITGEKLLMEFQSQPDLAKIPVLVLTGADDRDIRSKCLRWGASDYILKPFVPEELLSKIRTLFRAANNHKLQILLELAGAAAHNINQPLGVLIGRLDLLEMKANGREDFLRQIKSCMEAAENIQAIVRSLEDLKSYGRETYHGGTSIIRLKPK